MSDPIVNLWTTQQADARLPSPDALATRASSMRRRVFRRDLTEYAAGLLVIAAFGHIGWSAPEWDMRLACAVLIAGVCLTLWNLWRRRPKDDPAALGTDAVGYYRAQLVAQRDTLASVGRWYLGPFVPGMALFVIATARAGAQTMPMGVAIGFGTILAAFIGGVLYLVWRLNRRAARTLDTEIAALDAGRALTDLR